MLGSYRNLNSISQTLEDVVEKEKIAQVKQRKKSQHYSKELPTIEPPKKIAMWRKIAFGFGNFSRYTVIGIQAYFLNVFLLEVANIGSFWAGNILLLKQFYDGFTDPLVGRMSDNFVTRWGRRKPWILLASIPSGIFWILQWYLPRFEDSAGWLTFYYILVLLLFSTMNTFVSVPYNAMVPDIAVDYHDRTAVVLFQEVFGLSAVIIFSYFQAEAVEFFTDDDGLVNYRKGYLVASLITVWAVVVPIIISIVFVSERKTVVSNDEDYQGKNALQKIVWWFLYFLRDLVRALRFKEFSLIVTVFVMSMVAVYLFVNNFVLYVKYVLHAEDQTAYMMIAVQATAALSIFFWAFTSRQLGKKITFLMGCTLWIGGSVIIFFINEDDIVLFYIVCVFRAIGTGVGYLIPLAMLPDIIEIDKVKNNKQREGILYSLMILLQKAGVGIGVTLSNYVLGFAGYESPDKESIQQQEAAYQPDSVLWSFKILMNVVPIFCLFIALICIYFIRIDNALLLNLDNTVVEQSAPGDFVPKKPDDPKQTLLYND